MKPILMNTEMVRAILAGRKTVTRRVVKPPALYAIVEDERGNCIGSWREDEHGGYEYPTVDDCRYQAGDILYVRETWDVLPVTSEDHIRGIPVVYYRADGDHRPERWQGKWRPSIHMPREAARIFLRVTDVRVERLQDIQERGPRSAAKEGFANDIDLMDGGGASATKHFADLWDTTIKPADRTRYGWNANPCVWVIEFERISKEEAMK